MVSRRFLRRVHLKKSEMQRSSIAEVIAPSGEGERSARRVREARNTMTEQLLICGPEVDSLKMYHEAKRIYSAAVEAGEVKESPHPHP